MSDELDLDALERKYDLTEDWNGVKLVNALIAELRACRANFNDFVDATTYYRERAERAEARITAARGYMAQHMSDGRLTAYAEDLEKILNG